MNYIISLLLIIVPIIPIFSADSVAVSTFVKGKAQLIRYVSGKQKKSKIVKGTVFHPKDIVKTGKNGKVDIKFKNGSKVTVLKNSNFYIDSSSTSTVMQGKTKNNVEKNKDSSFWSMFSSKKEKKKFKFFESAKKISTAGVRGTTFSLDTGSEKEKANVKVYEGSVIIDSPGKESIIVNENEMYVAGNKKVIPFDPNQTTLSHSKPLEPTPKKELTKEIPKVTKEKPFKVSNTPKKPSIHYFEWRSKTGNHYSYECICKGAEDCKCEGM